MTQLVETASLGEVLGGRYELKERLASGGMATVFVAIDREASREVAVKIIRGKAKKNPELRERFLREGSMLKSIDHPNIVRVFDYGEMADGRVYVVMERLFGGTLGALLKQHPFLLPEQLDGTVMGVCAALHRAHHLQVVHRDLKPENIFLTDDGTAKLLDFGVSKYYALDGLTETGQVLGTPRYMAPEQLSGDRAVDHRVDIYSFGVIMYEALAGRPPFVGETPSDLIVAILGGRYPALKDVRPELESSFVELISRALDLTPSARYTSAEELRVAWNRALGRRSMQREAQSPPQPITKTQALGSFAAIETYTGPNKQSHTEDSVASLSSHWPDPKAPTQHMPEQSVAPEPLAPERLVARGSAERRSQASTYPERPQQKQALAERYSEPPELPTAYPWLIWVGAGMLALATATFVWFLSMWLS